MVMVRQWWWWWWWWCWWCWWCWCCWCWWWSPDGANHCFQRKISCSRTQGRSIEDLPFLYFLISSFSRFLKLKMLLLTSVIFLVTTFTWRSLITFDSSIRKAGNIFNGRKTEKYERGKITKGRKTEEKYHLFW